jgi:hypothetical protein
LEEKDNFNLINDDNLAALITAETITAGNHSDLGTHIKREQEEVGGTIEI